MNNDKVEKYKHLLDRFTDEERDAALDGLIEASDEVDPTKGNEEAFIHTRMKSRVIDQHRKQKRSTMMTAVEPTKKFVSTKPARSGRRTTNITAEFTKFYSDWLFSHDTQDSVRNRAQAEKDFDALEDAPTPRRIDVMNDVLSLDDAIRFDNEDSHSGESYAGNVLDPAPNPEEAFIESEEREELLALNGLKSYKLREYMYRFIPEGPEAGSEELRAAYKKALLSIAARVKNWKDLLLVCDIHLICQLAGVKTQFICELTPAEANMALSQLAAL